MKIKQKKHLLYKNTIFRINRTVIVTSSFVLALVFFVILLPTDSYAAINNQGDCVAAGGSWKAQLEPGAQCSGAAAATEGWLSCDGVRTSIISCADGDGSTPDQSGIFIMLKLAIQVMAAGVGILAVAGIVWGSVLYASAGGSQEQVKKATTVIRNTVFGLLIFVFMFAIINFLIPGGVLT